MSSLKTSRSRSNAKLLLASSPLLPPLEAANRAKDTQAVRMGSQVQPVSACTWLDCRVSLPPAGLLRIRCCRLAGLAVRGLVPWLMYVVEKGLFVHTHVDHTTISTVFMVHITRLHAGLCIAPPKRHYARRHRKLPRVQSSSSPSPTLEDEDQVGRLISIHPYNHLAAQPLVLESGARPVATTQSDLLATVRANTVFQLQELVLGTGRSTIYACCAQSPQETYGARLPSTL